MPIAYLILVLYSFIASRMHWPFGNVALVLGVLLLAVDIVIQIIRLALKRSSYHVLLLAFSLCMLSVGYLFIWLNWPGMKVTAWVCLVLALPGILLSFRLKGKLIFRKVFTCILFVSLTVFSLMKSSAFYCFRNNISLDDPMRDAPVFVVHQLAYLLYREDERGRAEELLRQVKNDLDQKTAYFRAQERDSYMLQVFVQDSVIVSSDLEQVENGNWVQTEPLLPEDIHLSELK